MFKLKLIRGRSYCGRGVKATFAKPFVTVSSKAVADYLVAVKRFVLVNDPAPADDKPLYPEGPPSEQWTVVQLRAFATVHTIDLAGLQSKADIVARIQEANAEGGKVDYGENE